MKLYKNLSVIMIILSIFSLNSYSMQKEKLPALFLDANEEDAPSEETPIIKEKEVPYCSHWGLSHWVSGVKEYFCCCLHDSKNGRFVHHYPSKDGKSESIVTSDLFFNIGSCLHCDYWGLAICCFPCLCPLPILCHLCCLPLACCEYAEKRQDHQYHAYQKAYDFPINNTYTIPSTSKVSDNNAQHEMGWQRQQEELARRENERRVQERLYQENREREARNWNEYQRAQAREKR